MPRRVEEEPTICPIHLLHKDCKGSLAGGYRLIAEIPLKIADLLLTLCTRGASISRVSVSNNDIIGGRASLCTTTGVEQSD